MHFYYNAASDGVPSSPPAATSSPANNPFLSPTRTVRPKEKRVPSVTPRRFRRFFAPRTFDPHAATRTTLGQLDPSAVNRQMISPQSLAGDTLSSDPICPSSPTERLGVHGDDDSPMEPPAKRRRAMALENMPRLMLPPRPNFENPASPALLEGLKDMKDHGLLNGRRKANLSHFFKASRKGLQGASDKSLTLTQQIVAADLDSSPLRGYQPQPIRKFRNRGFEAHLLDREHGFSSHAGKACLSYPPSDPRSDTAAFYSDSCDAYHCSPVDAPGTSIPFSLASCHQAPVTAIGDEQGHIRFFSTTKSSGSDDNVSRIVRVHDNAIMDLDFSLDDSRLASACGDRSARILDMHTQTVAVELGGGHWDSLRQVSFQPGQGNGHVLATSDRAGRVQIWDLRCSSLPAQCFSSGPEPGSRRDEQLEMAYARTVNTIDNAHERTVQGSTSAASVTALQWLPQGREHLLLTASEANASMKLWDTRYIRPRRHTAETPVASTPVPVTHAWRSYGITSMALSADAARLYAVCKDSTVYAYSTSHLVLGQAPELLDGAPKRRPVAAEGLGPLYGLKHERLRVSSFYVKCAVRPAGPDGGEVLAVGSSDGCAVLFPTDERHMRAAWARREHILPAAGFGAIPITPFPGSPMTPSAGGPTSSSSASSPMTILRAGTPLIRGHSREVTTLSWSFDGALVTASDDYFVRKWQRGAERARYLRRVGEFGGERHQAGWADVADDWDCDDDE